MKGLKRFWLGVVLLAMALLVGRALAVNYDGRIVVDSGTAMILTLDSATMITLLDDDTLTTTTVIDTNYYPSASGIGFGWFNNLILRYGISDVDTVTAVKMAGDSVHVGISLQVSMDGINWSPIFEDSTLRTRFTSSGDSIPRYKELDLDSYVDTIVGNLFRVVGKVYLLVSDSCDADTIDDGSQDDPCYDLADTVYLDWIRIWGDDRE